MLSLIFPAAVDHHPSDTLFDPWATDTHEPPFTSPPQQPLFSFSNTSGSEDNHQAITHPIDDRKQRRMISNRESARRSRMRKQKHLENLRNLVNRHKSTNRDLTNRLRFMIHQQQTIRRENEHLRSELAMLRQKLWDLHQVMRVWELPNQLLLTSAWPCNNNININNNINVNNNNMTSFNEQNPLSLIS